MKATNIIILCGCVLLAGCDVMEARRKNIGDQIWSGELIEVVEAFPCGIATGWRVEKNYLIQGSLYQVIVTNRTGEGYPIVFRLISGQPIPAGTEICASLVKCRSSAGGGFSEIMIAEKIKDQQKP